MQTTYAMAQDFANGNQAQKLIGRFPSKPHQDMSERYVHINTNEVIKMMADMGYSAASTSHRSPNLYGLHQVDFIRGSLPSLVSKGKLEALPRISFVNSNDGTARARIIAGIYRLICENGMMAGNVVASERITHIGDQARAILERIQAASKEAQHLFDKVDQWKGLTIDVEAREILATRAAEIRFPGGNVSPKMLLQVRRQEDVANDLWTVFNRIQENAMRGGLPGMTADGRRILSRPLSAVRASLDFNQKLWDLVEETSAALA